ncbi:unnamed protein product [marine sediment metagenome]|uniref:Uncharacterized protein n=1 Tax=marine sediment metagenome TaxID=412755 RepID=X1GCF2_9ZZZZ
MLEILQSSDILKNQILKNISKRLYNKPFSKLNEWEKKEVKIQASAPRKCQHGLNENTCNKCAYGD